MTTESRRLISASEIQGLEIRCKKDGCGVRTFIPAKYQGTVSGRCTHCGSMWFEENGERGRAIKNLMGAIQNLRTEGADKDMNLLIEITPDRT